MEPKAMDLKNCTIIFRDGTTPTPFELEIKLDEGNITWTETRNLTAKKDRGELDYIKEEDEENMTVELQCRFNAVMSSAGDDVTPHEFLRKEGQAAAYLSTADLCAADAIDIIVRVDQNCGTLVEDEIITFPEFTFNTIGGDFRAGTLSVSGMCNAVKPVANRTTFT